MMQERRRISFKNLKYICPTDILPVLLCFLPKHTHQTTTRLLSRAQVKTRPGDR